MSIPKWVFKFIKWIIVLSIRNIPFRFKLGLSRKVNKFKTYVSISNILFNCKKVDINMNRKRWQDNCSLVQFCINCFKNYAYRLIIIAYAQMFSTLFYIGNNMILKLFDHVWHDILKLLPSFQFIIKRENHVFVVMNMKQTELSWGQNPKKRWLRFLPWHVDMLISN